MEIIGGVGIEIVGDYSGLQSDLDAAQSLAASAATKIADALDIATPDTAPVTQALQQISDAATSTGQSIVSALDVQVAAPDVSAVVDSFAALSQAATDSATAISSAFSGDALPAPDTSAIIEGFAAIDAAAQQAAGDIAQEFSGTAIAAPDVSALIEGFAAVDQAAQQAASAVAEDFSGTTLPASDASSILDGLTAVEGAARQASDAMVADFADATIPAPDDSGILEDFTAIQAAADQTANAIKEDFSEVAIPAPDISGFTDALSLADEDLGKLEADYLSIEGASAGVSGALNDVGAALEQESAAAIDGQAALQVIIDKLKDGEIGGKEFISMANALADALEAAGAKAAEVGPEFGGAADGEKVFSDGAQAIIDKQQALDTALAMSISALGEIHNAYVDGAVSADALARAEEAVESAIVAAGSAVNQAADQIKTYSDAAQSVIDAQMKLDSELQAAQGALAEIQGAYATGAVSAETLARAEKELADAAQAAAPAIKDTGDAAHEASGGFADLATQILALGGISLTVGALVELGKSAIEAGDHLDDAAFAMSKFTGSAESAQAVIEGLKSVAQDEGLSFPKLVTAAQRMEALLPPGTDVVDVLGKIGNAAELMGTSIDATASKFDNLVRASSLSAKTLASMGLDMSDIAKAMEDLGASSELMAGGVKKAWAAMDDTQHVAVVSEALEKLDGVAKQMNDDIGGDTVRAMNDFYVAIAKLGDAIAPVARETLPVLIEGFKGIVTAGDFVVLGLKLVIDAVLGLAVVMNSAALSMAEVITKLASADFSGAAAAATGALGGIKSAVKQMTDEMGNDIKSAADFVSKVWTSDIPNAVKTGTDKISVSLADVVGKHKDAAASIQAAFEQIASFEDKLSAGGGVSQLQSAFENASKAINAVAKVDLPAAIKAVEDYTQAQINNGAGASVIMQAFQEFSKLVGQLAKIDLPAASAAMTDYIGKLSAAKEPIGIIQAALEQEEKMLQQLAKQDLQAAADGWDKLIQKLRDTNAPIQILNQALQDHVKFLDGVSAAADKAATAMGKAAVAFSDFNTKGAPVTQIFKDAATAMENLGIMAAKVPQPISDLNRAMIDAGASTAKAKNAFEDLHTPITTIVTDMDRLAQAAKSSGDWSAFLTGLDSVDKRIQELAKTDLPEAAKQFETFIQGMINSGAPIDLVQGQLSKLEPILKKMADEDLPGANTAWQKYLDLLRQVPSAVKDIQQAQTEQLQQDQQILASMQARGDAYGYILAQQQKVLQEEIALAEKTGADANDWVLGLEKVKLAQQDLQLQSHGMADQEVKMINDIISGFDQMGSVMADAIVNGKNLGDALIGQFKKIGQSILTDIINAALIPLKMGLIELIGSLLPGMSGALGAVGGSFGTMNVAAGNAASGLTALATAANTAAASINTSVNGAGADSAGKGGVGGIGSTVGMIAEVASAAAAVASAILLAHISSDTGHIEVNTRSALAEALNFRADAWTQHNQLYERLGEVKNSLDKSVDLLAQLKITTGNGLIPADSAALQSINKILGDNEHFLLVELQSIDASTQYINAGVQTVHNDLYQGFLTMHEDLFLIVGTIQTLTSALLYGKQSGQSYASDAGEIMQAADGVESAIQSASAQAHAQLSQIDTSVQADTASGRHNNQLTLDQQAQKRQEDLAAAQAAAQGASSIANQIVALRDEYNADISLMNNALAQAAAATDETTRAGFFALAAQYQTAAQQVSAQITPLLSATTSATNGVHAAVTTVNTSIINGSTDVAYSATNAGVLVSTAVGQSAVTISNAVINSAGASASLFNTGISSLISIVGAFGKVGGGLPGGQAGLPSGSGLGNTNPNGTASYTIPGVNNPGVVNGPQAGFNPNAPATGGMTQAQWNATGHASTAPDWWLKGLPQPGINQGNLPHFQTGGTVEIGGLAVVDTGELVLPEGLAAAVKGGETTIGTQPTANTTGGNVLFTEPNKVDLSSADKGFVDHGESVDPDAWKQLADQVAGVGAAIAAQDKARAAVADTMTMYQKEMTAAQAMLVSATQAGNKAQITVAQQWIAMMQGLIDATVATAKKPGVEVTTVGNKPGVDITTVGTKPGVEISKVSDDAAKAIGGAMNKTPVMDPGMLAVMAKPGIEMTSVAQDVAGSVRTVATAVTAIANGPMNKTPVQDPGGDPVKIVGITAEAAAFFGGTSGSAQQQQGPSQQDLLAASMAWLDAQQGITADQKAISAATYQADAKAGLLPSPGGSGSSFSGYNPYSTPAGPQAASLPSSTPSGPANKTPLIDPTFTQPYGPANKTPVQDIPSFDVGGFIGRDMLAMVHAGEFIIPNGKIALPPEVMARIQMPNIPGAPNVPNVPFSTGSSGGTGDSFTFIIQGITDPDLLAREISSRIKTRTGRTAKFSN